MRKKTQAQYSAWIDDHSLGDLLGLVAKALAAYAAVVTERGDAQFDPVFPLMQRILERAQAAAAAAGGTGGTGASGSTQP